MLSSSRERFVSKDFPRDKAEPNIDIVQKRLHPGGLGKNDDIILSTTYKANAHNLLTNLRMGMPFRFQKKKALKCRRDMTIVALHSSQDPTTKALEQ